MTNTDTADVEATVRQTAALARAGSEIVRITVNNAEAAAAVPHIRDRLDQMNVNVPLVGDFHFNGHRLLAQHPACAQALAKLRINPGNVGRGSKRDEQFATMIDFACRYSKPVRIGVNWGSLDPELLARLMDENARKAQPEEASVVTRHALVASALESARHAETLGLPHDRIVLSCKVSGVQDLIAVYRDLAACAYALHLGHQAAWDLKELLLHRAMAVLLRRIGDTIRRRSRRKPTGAHGSIVARQSADDGLRSSHRFHCVSRLCRTTALLSGVATASSYLRSRWSWACALSGVRQHVAVIDVAVNGPEKAARDIGIRLTARVKSGRAGLCRGVKTVTLKGDIGVSVRHRRRYVQEKYALSPNPGYEAPARAAG